MVLSEILSLVFSLYAINTLKMTGRGGGLILAPLVTVWGSLDPAFLNYNAFRLSTLI